MRHPNVIIIIALSPDLVLPHINAQTLSEDVQKERVAAGGLWRRPHGPSEPKINANGVSMFTAFGGPLGAHALFQA